MADLSITSAVPVSSDATNAFETGISNAAIAIGKSVYWDPATGLYGLFDSDSATTAVRTLRGIAVSAAASTGEAVVVQTAGTVTLGTTLTKGLFYVGGSGTAGGVAPATDISGSSGDYLHCMGIAISTAILYLKIFNTGTVM